MDCMLQYVNIPGVGDIRMRTRSISFHQQTSRGLARISKEWKFDMMGWILFHSAVFRMIYAVGGGGGRSMALASRYPNERRRRGQCRSFYHERNSVHFKLLARQYVEEHQGPSPQPRTEIHRPP